MADNEQVAAEQAERWNGPSGRAWIENQDLLDRLYRPFEDLLVSYVTDVSGNRVLDVGCGTGSTTLAASRAGTGTAVGVDISEPMIALARHRAGESAAAEFIAADMQTHQFTGAPFDTVVSRFGVMFFSDPVAAFRNMHHASANAANLRMIVWRSPGDDDIMVAAERATASLLPDLPPRPPSLPTTPGQFAFADAERVTPILDASGWRDITIEPLDIELGLPQNDMMRYVTTFGRVGMQLGDVDEATRTQVLDRLSDAFGALAVGDEVRYPAACWLISARA